MDEWMDDCSSLSDANFVSIRCKVLTATYETVHQKLLGPEKILFGNSFPIAIRVGEFFVKIVHKGDGESVQSHLSARLEDMNRDTYFLCPRKSRKLSLSISSPRREVESISMRLLTTSSWAWCRKSTSRPRSSADPNIYSIGYY